MSATRVEEALAAYKAHLENAEHKAFAELRVFLLLKDCVERVSVESLLTNIRNLDKAGSSKEFKHGVFLLGDLLKSGHADQIPTPNALQDSEYTYKDNWALLLKLAGARPRDMSVPDYGFFCDTNKKTALSQAFLPDSLCPPRFAPIRVAEVMTPVDLGKFDVYRSVMRDTHGSDIDAIDQRVLFLVFLHSTVDGKETPISAAFLKWKYSAQGLDFFAQMTFRLAASVSQTEKTIVKLALKARFPPLSQTPPSWPAKKCVNEDRSSSSMEHGELVLSLSCPIDSRKKTCQRYHGAQAKVQQETSWL